MGGYGLAGLRAPAVNHFYTVSLPGGVVAVLAGRAIHLRATAAGYRLRIRRIDGHGSCCSLSHFYADIYESAQPGMCAVARSLSFRPSESVSQRWLQYSLPSQLQYIRMPDRRVSPSFQY